MKKVIMFVFGLMLLLLFIVYKTSQKVPSIDYGNSKIFNQADMDSAIALIKETFNTWDGCELHNIRYAGDECNSTDNIKWMNQLETGKQNSKKNYTQCIEFLSDFHSPVKQQKESAWQIDKEYTDYSWWLARTDGGMWELMTWGY